VCIPYRMEERPNRAVWRYKSLRSWSRLSRSAHTLATEAMEDARSVNTISRPSSYSHWSSTTKAGERVENAMSTLVATSLSIHISSSPLAMGLCHCSARMERRTAATSYTLVCDGRAVAEKNPRAGTRFQCPLHPHGEASVVTITSGAGLRARSTSGDDTKLHHQHKSRIAPWKSLTARDVERPRWAA